jgi:hypothetical protein
MALVSALDFKTLAEVRRYFFFGYCDVLRGRWPNSQAGVPELAFSLHRVVTVGRSSRSGDFAYLHLLHLAILTAIVRG